MQRKHKGNGRKFESFNIKDLQRNMKAAAGYSKETSKGIDEVSRNHEGFWHGNAGNRRE